MAAGLTIRLKPFPMSAALSSRGRFQSTTFTRASTRACNEGNTGLISTNRRWLLLHGTPLTPEVWQATARHLSSQPVEIPDLTAVPDSPEAQRDLAEQIAADISGELDVVGHSFGGQIALELALAIPGRVRSLTIMCSRDTPYPAFAGAASAVRDGHAPSVEATLGRWFPKRDLDNGTDIVQVARQCLETASLEDWTRALLAIAGYDSSTRTPSLTMPVTLVSAGNDSVSTPEIMKDMANRIPNSVLQVHNDWSHMSPFVDPRRLARLLIEARSRS